ncbi:MAG: cytochrome c3 family protein [Planctomycetota bacterium]
MQRAKISFEFGSGTHAHTYAFRDGAFWCESPLSWYADGVGWDVSPGFETRLQPEFDREITNRCVYCHVGAIEQWDHSPHRFEIRQASIGCERCHGGGHDHIQYQSRNEADRSDTHDPIVNPAKLSRATAEAVCAQCHLQGDQLIVAEQTDVWDFAPGQALESNRMDIRLRGQDGHRIVGHTEQLRNSPCYIQSATLSCVTCHDPHGDRSRPDATYYRDVCWQCHTDDACGLDQGLRLETNSNDCSSCHMPVQPTNVVHAALHQHRIGIHAESYPPAAPVASASPRKKIARDEPLAADEQPRSLYPLINLVASNNDSMASEQMQRRQALAVYNAVFNGVSGDEWETDMAWARDQLITQLKRNPRDRAVRVTLARDYLNHGQTDQAERLLGEIVGDVARVDRVGIQSIAILAEIRMRQRNSILAKPHYQRLTALRRLSGDHYFHGLCCVNTGETEGAIQSFQSVLRIDAHLAAAHQQLAVIFASRGERELAESHNEASRTSGPNE